jgi:biotin transport system substrate-specific component
MQVLTRAEGFERKKITDIFQIALASIFIGLCAQIKIPLFFTPIPLTGQTFGVMAVGAFLGSRKGALAALAYLFEGALGLPVFAGGAGGAHIFLGMTGGYLMAYPLQAYFVGWFLERGSFRFIKTVGVFALSCLLQLALGSLWIARFAPLDKAFAIGFYPFLPIEMAKALILSSYLKFKNKRGVS